MPEIVQQAQLSDDEVSTLAEAASGTTVEELLKNLRTALNSHRSALKAAQKNRSVTAEQADDALRELDARIRLFQAQPDSIGQLALEAHERAHALLTEIVTALRCTSSA